MLLDRLSHHVHILEVNGDSYRFKQSKRRARCPSGQRFASAGGAKGLVAVKFAGVP